VLPGGLAILMAVFEAFEIQRMSASQGALREGLLYDMVGRIRHEDVRDRTVRRLMDLYRLDALHASRVERSALSLFEQVHVDWQLDPERDRQLLSWVSRLHEVGLSIAHSGHHRHGAYIVEHSVLPGFTRGDQRLLAALILGHRRKLSPERLAPLIPPGEELRVLRLAALLRLGVLLNRSRAALPHPRVRAAIKKDALELRFASDWFERHPLTRADLLHESAHLLLAGIELRLATA
jgi:exopolyphosphatase / guanosine-5'-triphosphate,3'-diphosphate pyrophosphatase